ncbi:MAG: condensation domain-containing protein [Methylococcaceae bacterium]
MKQLLDYWKARLAYAPALELPTDKPRPAVQSLSGENRQFKLPTGLTDGIKALSRREGVTLFMTLVSAFQILLHRYTGQDDIVIGTLTVRQSSLELEGLNGIFGNPLVLRTDLSYNPSFRELLTQVREVTLGAYANKNVPFEKLVEALNLQSNSSRNPLFQVMFLLQNTPDEKIQLNEASAKNLQINPGTTKFDLTLELTKTPDGLAGRVEYATDLFEAATIDRLIGHYQTLLAGIVAHPDARLSELPLLTEPERRQLLLEWNDTAAELPDDPFIYQLFEEQVERTVSAK